MNKLLVILNMLQFAAILILTNPKEADHKKFLAEKMGGAALIAWSNSVATAGVVAMDPASTSVVAAVTAEAAATNDVETVKEPRCEYQDLRFISLYRQGDKVLTLGFLKVWYVGDVREKFNK